MQLQDAITLLKHDGLSTGTATIWADFGSGRGLFTRALSTLLAPGSKIYAVDKNAELFEPGANIVDVFYQKVNADFTSESLPISDLDGIMMANSLHFVSDKISFIKKCRKHFKGTESFLIVEYDIDTSNRWVPYPVSYASLRQLFASLGFKHIQKIHDIPSKFSHGKIYSSLVMRQ